jgi:hypothetical protein
MVYGFGSLALSSGSYWHYAITFASLYYVVSFVKEFVTQFIRKHDRRKSTAATKARKKNSRR